MSNNLPILMEINKDLGENFDNLIFKCSERRKVLLETNNDIIMKIKSQVDGGHSNMSQVLSKVHEERLEIISLKKKVEQLKFEYVKFKKENENVKINFQILIKDLKYKCNRYMYFTCIQCVSSKSNKIKTYLSSKRDNEAINTYMILCKLSFAMNVTQCKHLISYINGIINYWNYILEQYYSEDFKTVLKQINWPFTITESMDAGKLENFKQNFQRLSNILLKIDFFKNTNTNINDMQQTSNLMDQFTHVNIPISILIIPFRKRFLFHFTGKKQTNKANKPEWYLSRVLSWIRDYRMFFLEWLGPIYEKNNKNPIDSQNEFIIGLLQSVVMKLDSDLSCFELEDMVFCHIVDETLTFEHELRKVYGYPENYPNVTEVLTQPHIFLKWINLERKYANAKIDDIMLKKDEWKVLVNDNKYCLISCADNLLTLLNTMSDRYNIICKPRHKLQFLKLQIDLLHEFKEKIIVFSNEINQSNEHLIQILCILHYIAYTLNNWGTNVHFLSLLNYKCELVKSLHESDNIILENVETVFDDPIKSYNLAIDNLLNILCDNIIDKVKIHSKPYKRDRWHIMNSLPDENKYNITDSGWIMYETFADNLNTLNKSLPISLFNKCWPILATKLSTFIFNEILLSNMFNKGGSQHLFCDVQYKLLPIISKYTIKPTIYIERLLEACKVLCCQPNIKPVTLTKHEISEILLRRIEHGNSMDIE